MYGAAEMPTDSYPARTKRNALESDGTIWFGDTDSPGGRVTLATCRAGERPYLVVADGVRPSAVVAWLRARPHVRTVNVAGNRESTSPGIGARVERFMADVFRQLGHEPAPPESSV